MKKQIKNKYILSELRRAKKQIAKATDFLMRVEEVIEEGIEGTSPVEQQQEEDFGKRKVRVELWCRIHKKGGVVTEKMLRHIWEDVMHRDYRGIGGFFCGRRASLMRLANRDVALTDYARQSILAWASMDIDEVAEEFKDE
jgi:hypothetical protein